MPARLTQDQAEQKAIVAGFRLLSEYTNSEAVVRLECISCGDITHRRYDATLVSKTCRNCKRNTKDRKSTETVDNECFKNGFKRLSPYTKAKDYGEFSCTTCGHVIKTDFYNMCKGNRTCPRCAGKETQPVTYERILTDLIARDIEFLSEHSERYDTSAYYRFRHITCGKTWESRLGNVLYGTSCPHCSKSNPKSEKEIVDALESLGACNITFKDGYSNNKSCVTFSCNQGHVNTRPVYSILKHGMSCRECYHLEKYRALEKEFAEKSIEIVQELPTVYVTHLQMRCTKCGNTWNGGIGFHKRRSHDGCTKCCDHGKKGIDLDEELWLYYLRISFKDNILYKIGVTKHEDILSRYQTRDRKFIKVLDKLYYSRGQDAYEHEQQLLRDYAEHRYQGPPILKSGGNTELLYTDVLGLDKSNQDTQPKAS